MPTRVRHATAAERRRIAARNPRPDNYLRNRTTYYPPVVPARLGSHSFGVQVSRGPTYPDPAAYPSLYPPAPVAPAVPTAQIVAFELPGRNRNHKFARLGYFDHINGTVHFLPGTRPYKIHNNQ